VVFFACPPFSDLRVPCRDLLTCASASYGFIFFIFSPSFSIAGHVSPLCDAVMSCERRCFQVGKEEEDLFVFNDTIEGRGSRWGRARRG